MGIKSCYVSLSYTLQDTEHPCPELYQNARASGTCENHRRPLKFPKIPLGGGRAPIENNCPLFNVTLTFEVVLHSEICIPRRVVFVIRECCQAVPFHGFLLLHTGLRSRRVAVHSSKPISRGMLTSGLAESMGSSRQEYLSGLPFPSPEDLPHLLTCIGRQILDL